MSHGAPDWMPAQVDLAGPEHLDESYVAGYEAKAGYDPTEDVAAVLGAGVGAGDVVVDLGAGTGVFTRALAPHVGRVVAVDVSAPMIATLRAAVAADGLTNVEVVRAGFLDWAHDGAVAAVFSRNALHQLPDFWKGVALARIHDALAPGGLLRLRDLVYDFEPAEAPVRIEAWLAGAVDDPRRGYTAEEYATHVRTEFATYRWLLDALLDHTGFEVIAAEVHAHMYAAYTCRRP